MVNRIGAANLVGLMFCAATVAGAQDSVPARPTAQSPQRLDLRIPHITELYTHEQIQALLAPTFLETREYTEEVEVQGRREAITPTVWRGIAAPFWAIFNPTQAWRIIAPFPPDQSRALAFNADVTTPYQEPAARTAADP